MKLRRKTLLIIGVTFLSLFLVVYATSQIILLKSFSELEEQNTRQNVERATNAFQDEIETLKTLSIDWAAWDDTYRFVEDSNEDYIQSNLQDKAIVALKLNLMLYVNSSDQVMYGKYYNYKEGYRTDAPAGMQEYLTESTLLNHTEPTSYIAGIIILPEGPMLVASRPIVTSYETGPIRGTLIMGRYLDADEVGQLEEITRLSIRVSQLNGLDAPSDVEEAKLVLSNETPVYVHTINETTIAGYTLMGDIFGRPALVMRVDTPRSIYQQGQSTIRYLLLYLVTAGVVIEVVMMFLLETTVLSRLTRLSFSVKDIGTQGDLTTRVNTAGDDEISSLGNSINDMLSILESAQNDQVETNERYRRLVELSPDGITVVIEGKLAFINTAGAMLLGASNSEQLLGSSMANFVDPDSIARIEEKFRQMEKDESSIQKMEMTLFRLDTNSFEAEIAAAPLTYQGKSAIQVIFRDVTERKKIDRLKEEFFASVTHELKTPITSMLSFAESVRTNKVGPISENQREVMEYIVQDAVRLRQIVDRILTFSKVDVGIKMHMSDVDIEALIDKALSSFALSAKDKQITLLKRIPEKLPLTYGDLDRLTDVLNNLIGNAIKFTGPQGSITVEAVSRGNDILILVSDTGIGISKEDLSKIFSKFYQVDPSKTGVIGGSGLGLYICKKIVEAHNGLIWVNSTLGKGTTFYFTLPKKNGGK
ncbi:Methanogenesis regulatory histidine kinase FilI [uncultured archaeon]|nr:Methanogenesis regulatory histidine kinase FilI [uncultured archaeon]